MQLGADIYPSYVDLGVAKKRCYPEIVKNENGVIFTPLQSLLNHTAERLLLTIPMENIPNKVTIFYKLGFDGSSGQSQYKHMSDNDNIFNSTMFMTTLVPIRIVSEADHTILWQNPATSSTR